MSEEKKYYKDLVSSKQPAIGESILNYYIRMLRRRFWIVTTAFIIVLTIGTVKTFRTQRVYEAKAKILVERQAPRLINIDDVQQNQVGWDPEFYQTEADMARSRSVLETALEKNDKLRELFGGIAPPAEKTAPMEDVKKTIRSVLGNDPIAPPEPWETLRNHIRSQHLIDTHFILVKAESTNPQHAALMANAVAKAFEDYHVILQVEMHGDTFEFLRREKEKEENELKAAEEALQEFRRNTKMLPLSGDEKEQPPVIKHLNEINSELTQTQLQRIDLNSQLKVIDEITSNKTISNEQRNAQLFSVPEIRKDKEAIDVRNEITEAEKAFSTLLETYGPQHPTLLAAQANVKILKEKFTETMDRLILALNNRLKTLISKENDLQAQYEEQKIKALEFSRENFEYTRLENEAERHRKLFNTLVERMRNVEASSDYVRTNAEVVEMASVPTVPIRPDKSRSVIISALLGLMLGMGLAFLFENLDESIKTPEDLKERLGLPVLGFVPKVEPKEEHKDIPMGLICLYEPFSSATEAYRNVRTSLFFSIPADSTRSIAIGSCGPGEGKTTTAVNIAITIATSGRKVILIDADFHRPMVNKILGLENEKGLTNVLTGDLYLEDAIQKIYHEDHELKMLDVLTAGPRSPNPAELLGSHVMKELIDHLKHHYDWVIVDTPPVLFVSDASIVSAMCDGFILVVKSGKNNRTVLKRAIDHLDSLKINVIGSILNMMTTTRFGRYYTSYSYVGYSKYSSDYHKSYYSDKDRDKPKDGPAERGKEFLRNIVDKM